MVRPVAVRAMVSVPFQAAIAGHNSNAKRNQFKRHIGLHYIRHEQNEKAKIVGSH